MAEWDRHKTDAYICEEMVGLGSCTYSSAELSAIPCALCATAVYRPSSLLLTCRMSREWRPLSFSMRTFSLSVSVRSGGRECIRRQYTSQTGITQITQI